jgi:hypothetical protein
MTEPQTTQINLAIGRIFRMASRPEQAGDIAEYERCRSLILNTLDPDMAIHHAVMAKQHDVGRDRMKGAQGQW